jgi:periplasmic copper chaperone A
MLPALTALPERVRLSAGDNRHSNTLLQEIAMSMLRQLSMAAALALAAGSAAAQTEVKEPWIRATVPGQMGTGMFAQITSARGGKLVSASSPMASIVEIHEMAMDGGVMKMREVPAVELPAGRSVELKPGGFHVMLMDLKQTMKAGDVVPVTLVVQGGDGKRESITVRAEVKALPTRPPQ